MDVHRLQIYNANGYLHTLPSEGYLSRHELHEALHNACQILSLLPTESCFAYENLRIKTCVELRVHGKTPLHATICMITFGIPVLTIQGYIMNQIMYVHRFHNHGNLTKDQIELLLHVFRYLPEPYTIAHLSTTKTTALLSDRPLDINSFVLGF